MSQEFWSFLFLIRNLILFLPVGVIITALQEIKLFPFIVAAIVRSRYKISLTKNIFSKI